MLGYDVKAQATKIKIDKLKFIRIKTFVLQRTPSRERKDNLQNEIQLQVTHLIKD